ncbi:unnamed protein product, partial [Sphacelaria rigidula]
ITSVTCGGLGVFAVADGKILSWGCGDDGALGRRVSAQEEKK